MLTAREQFRHLVDRELGEPGLTRERRMQEALIARRCRNLFWNCIAPVVTGGAAIAADTIVQAQTKPFGAPVIVTDILNFDEVYRSGFFQGVVWTLMRLFTSGIGAQSDFFGAGNFTNSLMTLGHYQSNATLNTDAPSLKAHFMPYLMPTGEIFQVNWELLDIGGPNGNVETAAVAVGGAGYSLGDILTLTTGGTGATVQVTGVLAGVVTSVAIITTGSGYAAGVSATAGGTGAGATITITVTPSTVVRARYNAEADFRGIQVLQESDPYGQLCGNLHEAVCRYISGSEPETFILDLEVPTTSFPASGDTAVFNVEAQERPLLIYGIGTNINGAQISMRDPSCQWEFAVVNPVTPTEVINAGVLGPGLYPNMQGVPINVMCGNGDLTYHEAYNMLPVPHLLAPNTSLAVRLLNGLRPDGTTGAYTQTMNTTSNFGNSTGNGHIAFLCRTV